jgi:hypothetical protein
MLRADSNKKAATPSRGALGRSLEPWCLPLIPAAIAAIGLIELLLFLHPDWDPFDPALSRGILLYTALFAPFSIALHLLASWVFHIRVRRLLPWTVVLLVASGAIILGGHASYYSFFLPPLLNGRMVRAALWLALGAALGFYTALAHSLHWRRYGSRSFAFFVLLVAGSLILPYERRIGFAAASLGAPRIPAPESILSRDLLWVELPGLTPDIVLPLAEQGRLPFFSSLLEKGAGARLAGIQPTVPLASRWALLTGVRPDQHRVFGLVSWKPAWNPKEKLTLLPLLPGFQYWGLLEVDRPAEGEPMETWVDLPTLLQKCGYLSSQLEETPRSSTLASTPGGRLALRTEAERELELLGAPQLAEALNRDLATLHAVQGLLGASPGAPRQPRAIFAVLKGVERASLANFGALVAVELEGRRGRELERHAAALMTYYATLDREFANLALQLPEETLLVLVSPYGMASPSTLARLWGEVSGSPLFGGTLQGGPDGILLLRGRGFLGGSFVETAELVDVVPTVLYALGLPGARDLSGHLLIPLFHPEFLQQHPLTFLPSYRGVVRTRIGR